jgi:hypothetical protein
VIKRRIDRHVLRHTVHSAEVRKGPAGPVLDAGRARARQPHYWAQRPVVDGPRRLDTPAVDSSTLRRCPVTTRIQVDDCGTVDCMAKQSTGDDDTQPRITNAYSCIPSYEEFRQ